MDVTGVKARARGIRVVSRLTPGLPASLVGDPARLSQILTNLLGNAVKFTESGEVALTVRSPGNSEPGKVEFAISDTGIGIPPEKLESIFDDFTQADSSITRKYGGTGLGLGISRRIVEAMGGRLTVTSPIGEGSTFRFAVQFDPVLEKTQSGRVTPGNLHSNRLVCDAPAIRDCAESDPLGAVDCDTPSVKPVRILVAEDSRDNRLLVQVYLKGGPYELTFEEDGMAAADRCSTSDFDLLLMDVEMPVMDGLAATRAIRARERERGVASIPILALTASASLQDIERSYAAGCNSHLSKPISKLQLLIAIERYRRKPRPETVVAIEE